MSTHLLSASIVELSMKQQPNTVNKLGGGCGYYGFHLLIFYIQTA